jgi:molybdate transport system substrate-binding protein
VKHKLGFLIAFMLVLVQPVYAKNGTTDLTVLSAAAMKGVVQQVPDHFFAATGAHVHFVFGTAGQIREKVLAGDRFDVVIIPPSLLTDLAKRGLVQGKSIKGVGSVRIGVAVKADDPLPKIGDEASFKQALLGAVSIGMADPGTGATSGIYLAKLMDRLGVAEAIHAKVKYYPEGQTAMEAMAKGKVALGIGQISEIMPVQGVTLVGPIPENLQLKTIYAIGIASKGSSQVLAQKFLAYVTGPQVRASLKANGFDPGS